MLRSKLNGETGVVTTKVAYESPYNNPGTPVRDGYTFKRFSKKLLGSEAYVFSTPIAEDITLYAVWEIKDTPKGYYPQRKVTNISLKNILKSDIVQKYKKVNSVEVKNSINQKATIVTVDLCYNNTFYRQMDDNFFTFEKVDFTKINGINVATILIDIAPFNFHATHPIEGTNKYEGSFIANFLDFVIEPYLGYNVTLLTYNEVNEMSASERKACITDFVIYKVEKEQNDFDYYPNILGQHCNPSYKGLYWTKTSYHAMEHRTAYYVDTYSESILAHWCGGVFAIRLVKS